MFMRLFYKNTEFVPLQSLRNVVPTNIPDRDSELRTGGLSIIAYSTIPFPKDDVDSWHYLDGSDSVPLRLVETSLDGGIYYAGFKSRAA
jgi:hypothetical protein